MTTNTRGVSEAMPEAFAEYVAKNYSGEVVFSNPRWHAERLWRAARYAATLRHAPALADMAKRLEAAERDSKRMDWLCSGKVYWLEIQSQPSGGHVYVGPPENDKLRRNIDAAIDATQEGEG